MLGATTNWGIQALNFFGLTLGLLVGVKRVISWRTKRIENRFGDVFRSGKCIRLVLFGIGFILVYVLCSVINPRAVLEYTYSPGSVQATGVEITDFEPIQWLPRSYDASRSFRAFLKYLSLSCVFIAIRDWLLTCSTQVPSSQVSAGVFPSRNVELLLWSMSISSAALALVGMLQRLDGTDNLLWVFENHLNGGRGAFGPFPYQSNAAQFLNLMWPVMLGFWWVLRQRNQAQRRSQQKFGSGSHVMILVFTVLTAAAVVLTQSKVGAVILVGQMIGVLMFLVLGIRRQSTVKVTVSILMVAVLGVGGWLGGRTLTERFLSADLENLSGRKLIYRDAVRMVEDFKLFGSGAETFAPLYFFYRNENPSWDAYVHNDYLETLITFGWLGLSVIILTFILIWLGPIFDNGIPAPPEFIVLIGVAMTGLMAHARYDLPFQIYSLHFEFVVLCALVTCLKWERR